MGSRCCAQQLEPSTECSDWARALAGQGSAEHPESPSWNDYVPDEPSGRPIASLRRSLLVSDCSWSTHPESKPPPGASSRTLAPARTSWARCG